VADHQQSQAAAQAEQHKSVLVLGVIRVVDELGILIRKDGLSVFEADPVLALVGRCLLGIPLESEHDWSVRILYIHRKSASESGLCGLTCELSGRRRNDRQALEKTIFHLAAEGPGWHAGGSPLERGVGRQREAPCAPEATLDAGDDCMAGRTGVCVLGGGVPGLCSCVAYSDDAGNAAAGGAMGVVLVRA